ncbi:MAG: HIT family protein [Burkholderiaceae bacterium]|nr:HIT family protein [Burkholderiaceae bacterium]MCD8516985.1 HIT family protein [Burkholderiaceae bacterium]MCD8537677.1 HIT family protein [Burkholderiaceae bacterium]
MTEKPCPFCTLPQDRIVDQNDLAMAIRDGFPVSPGHTLVIPKRHVGSFFELGEEEVQAMMGLLKKAKANLDKKFNPDSYNIGVNDGPQAGQTVPHVHMHLIPRYQGDVQDPRGGVRWLIPEKADYWSDREG